MIFLGFSLGIVSWKCSDVKRMDTDIIYNISEQKKNTRISNSKISLRVQLVQCRKTHIFATLSNNRESNRNQRVYRSGKVYNLAILNELTSQKNFRVETFCIFFWSEMSKIMSVFIPLTFEHFCETFCNEKPSKIIDFSCPEPQIQWISLDFLVRTYLVQPPCLPRGQVAPQVQVTNCDATN